MKKTKETLRDLTVKEYNRKINTLNTAANALIEAGCIEEARVVIRKGMFFKQARHEYINNIK